MISVLVEGMGGGKGEGVGSRKMGGGEAKGAWGGRVPARGEVRRNGDLGEESGKSEEGEGEDRIEGGGGEVREGRGREGRQRERRGGEGRNLQR